MSGSRVVDLFAGAGGLAEGFRQAGFAITAGTDVDPDACATFELNFPEADTIWGDIRLPAVKERVLEAARNAEVIVGGPPCQAFSQVRDHSRLIEDPRNSLYREFVAVVATVRPRAFVMENVPGLEQMGTTGRRHPMSKLEPVVAAADVAHDEDPPPRCLRGRLGRELDQLQPRHRARGGATPYRRCETCIPDSG